MKTIWANLSKHYPIYIAPDLTNEIVTYLVNSKKSKVIITDSNLVHNHGSVLLQKLQKKNCSAELLYFPAGEEYKIRETKHQLEDELLSKQYGRDTLLIALGGGVVTDMVGFIAATYCRGLSVIYIPTTLLAMVDASIGGKTGVNTPHGKNLIGTFTQPDAVFIDINMLQTLPEDEWQNGIAEMVKHALIADGEIFDKLKNNLDRLKQDSEFLSEMIHASCLIKKNIVEEDEQEQGRRQLLNFGHTIGHAIEAIEEYQIGHGAAVAIGMLVEIYISIQLGYLQESVLHSVEDVLRCCGLPLKTKAFHNHQRIHELLKLDKKSIKNISHFVLLQAIGVPHQRDNLYAVPVDVDCLNQALHWAEATFS